jgi:DNA-binding MarR family transcriptional regulator
VPTSLHSREQHTHRLLSEIEAGPQVSQRSLARRLGIALGLTNLLLRRVVRKGWVRMIQIQPNRVSYLLTPTGIAEKARMSRESLKYSVRFYAEARARISGQFAQLSAEWLPGGSEEKRIVFFGTGEVAEIGYVCLQETDLRLVGVVDNHGRRRFFDVPLIATAALTDVPFDRLVIMSFENSESIRDELRSCGFPLDRVFWV